MEEGTNLFSIKWIQTAREKIPGGHWGFLMLWDSSRTKGCDGFSLTGDLKAEAQQEPAGNAVGGFRTIGRELDYGQNPE